MRIHAYNGPRSVIGVDNGRQCILSKGLLEDTMCQERNLGWIPHARIPTVPKHIARSFHQERLKKDTSAVPVEQLPPLTHALMIRTLSSDDEIECVSWLRAKAFYAYPPERKFAGEIHQMMIAEEESKSLKALRLDATLQKKHGTESNDKTITLVAFCTRTEIDNPDENLCFTDTDGSHLTVVGSLDIHFAKALAGEVLIGSSEHAAYLANVCTADAAKRRGVAAMLLQRARDVARENEADDLFVHTMAVNEIARAFYEKNGFVVEKEETSNQAHYRGRCLDGVEGLARTVLLRDSLL